jgi:hypothetical protein
VRLRVRLASISRRCHVGWFSAMNWSISIAAGYEREG